MSEELLYNQLYERTKDFGRTQFIKELMRLERENQQLKETLDDKCRTINALKIALKERTDERDKHSDKEYLYKSVIDEIREYITKTIVYEDLGDGYCYNCDEYEEEEFLQIIDKVLGG